MTRIQEKTVSAKYGKQVRGPECYGEFDLMVSLTAEADEMYSLLCAAISGLTYYRKYLIDVEREDAESPLVVDTDRRISEIKATIKETVMRAKKLDEKNGSFVYAYLDCIHQYGA